MKIPARAKTKSPPAHDGSASPAESESGAPALLRGLAVLELLAASEAGATLSEIGAALRLSPASVFRITGVLEETGYLTRDENTRRFSLTRKLLLLSRPRHEGRSLVECCIPSMREVLQETGETVQLCTLAGEECVMIEQLPSTHPFKYIVDIGSRPPLHCCAPGKAMLAFLEPHDLHQILVRLTLSPHTMNTHTTRDSFVAELEAVRERGYAVDRAEHFEGIHCVAAPILDRLNRPVASITIAGPSSRITARKFAEFGQIMKKAAQAAATRYLG